MSAENAFWFTSDYTKILSKIKFKIIVTDEKRALVTDRKYLMHKLKGY